MSESMWRIELAHLFFNKYKIQSLLLSHINL